MKVFSSNIFTVDKERQVMSTDMSIIREFEGFNNDYKIGLQIRSEKTGVVTSWVVNDIHHNVDHDVIHWELEPTTQTIGKNPRLADWKVIVWNT